MTRSVYARINFHGADQLHTKVTEVTVVNYFVRAGEDAPREFREETTP